jgi:uncharacterized protein
VRIAAQPGLYDPADETPRLQGIRCEQCGATFFPPFGIGCEVCGAPESALQAASLDAMGVLHSVATVHLHGGKDIEAPFAIGEIQLDAGPLIRATLTNVVEPEAIGARAAAHWVVVRTDDDGNDVVEPRFEVVA